MKRPITLISLTIIALLLIGQYIITRPSMKNGGNSAAVQPEQTIPTQGTPQSTTEKTFTVEGSNFSFTPDKIVVNQGDTVHIQFKNMDGFHDLVIDEFGVRTKQIPANQEETITFVADKKGTFEFYCSVGSHRKMGMVGTLEVM